MKGSFVDIISKLGVLAVAALMVFAFYTLFIDKPFYEEGSYGFDRDSREVDSGTIDADRTVDSIEVRNISGRIYAEGWDEDFVRLDYRKFGPGEPPEVAVDYSEDRMIIKAVYPKRPAAFGSVDFELKIPENVTLVEAGTVSGAVKISGVTEETVQRLSTTSGSIETDSSGDLDISSVSGSLKFSSSGRRIEGSTTSGRIEGTLVKDSGSGRISLSSVSGRIVLEVPEDINADVDLHSVSGSVGSEIPVAVTESRKKAISGTIGSGGTDIEIGTVSGSIKLKK